MDRSKDSVYSRQLGEGFSALHFEQPLEAEFRAHFVERNCGVQRFGAAQGLVFVSLLALLDWRMLPAELSAVSATLRLVGVAPLLLALLLATYPGALGRRRAPLSMAAGGALAATAIALLVAAPPPLLQRYVLDANLATLFVYLMLGLRFYPAVCLNLPLAAAGVWVLAGSEPTGAAYNCVFILLVNVVGAYSCYRLEHSARTIFLEKAIVDLLSGSDGVTGIPNRRVFSTHLQNLRRQGTRESRGIALVLIDLEGLDALQMRHGARAANLALRQIAHAIAPSARRPLDLVARFDERRFALLLYDPDAEYLAGVGRQIREAVARLDLPQGGSEGRDRLLVRTGAAYSRGGGAHDAEQLLETAARAVDLGKHEGNDGLVIALVPASAGEARVTSGPWAAS